MRADARIRSSGITEIVRMDERAALMGGPLVHSYGASYGAHPPAPLQHRKAP